MTEKKSLYKQRNDGKLGTKGTVPMYNLTDEQPVFMEKLSNHLLNCWQSPGSIACHTNKIGDKSYEIMFYPAIREVYGGAQDGEKVFPGFLLNIGKFMKVFDKKPGAKLTYCGVDKNIVEHFLFQGYVDGNRLKIAVLISPPWNQEAMERVYVEGPRAGQVEPTFKGE